MANIYAPATTYYPFEQATYTDVGLGAPSGMGGYAGDYTGGWNTAALGGAGGGGAGGGTNWAAILSAASKAYGGSKGGGGGTGGMLGGMMGGGKDDKEEKKARVVMNPTMRPAEGMQGGGTSMQFRPQTIPTEYEGFLNLMSRLYSVLSMGDAASGGMNYAGGMYA